MIGELRYLSDCKLGVLIRIPHRNSSVLGFACRSMVSETVSGFVALSGEDAFTHIPEDSSPLVLDYGKEFILNEYAQNDTSVTIDTSFIPGRLALRMLNDGSTSKTLLVKMSNNRVGYYDIEAGRMRGEPGGFGFSVDQWYIDIKVGSDLLRMLSR